MKSLDCNTVWVRVLLVIMLSGFSISSPALGTMVKSSLGFPDVDEWEFLDSKYQFQFTGESQRKFLFLRVYDVAHYAENRSSIHSGEEILSGSFNRQLSIRYQHDISAKRVRSALLDGFELNSTDTEWLELETPVRTLLSRIKRDIRSGDELVIRWLSNDRVMFFLNGGLIAQTKNRLFARVLWSIWLGPKSVVDRDELLTFWHDRNKSL